MVSNRLKCVNILPIIKVMSKGSLFKYLLIGTLLFVLSISFIKSSFDVLKSKKRLDELNAEIVSMERKSQELEESINYKKTDEYVEEKARNDLSLIKPGEQVYVVVKGDETAMTEKSVLGESSDNNSKKGGNIKDSNWYSWYSLFFK